MSAHLFITHKDFVYIVLCMFISLSFLYLSLMRSWYKTCRRPLLRAVCRWFWAALADGSRDPQHGPDTAPPPSHSPLPHTIPCKDLSNHYLCSCFRLNSGSHQRPCSFALGSTHLYQPNFCAFPWVSLKKVKAALQQCKSAVIKHTSSHS